ncbi:MAG: hypothetical protein WC959_03670 [Kiritimatiellales bacterium]
MAYRSGTYIAFDGLGQIDPSQSDFKYYATIQAWDAHKTIKFDYVDSHDKTYAVLDTSSRITLEARIRERLANSKNVIIILSGDTRKYGSMLSYEIEQAADKYKLPLIIAYVDYKVVAAPLSLSSYWPNALAERIKNKTIRAIHIPFLKETLFEAIKQYSPENFPKHACSIYNEVYQRTVSGVRSGPFINTKK